MIGATNTKMSHVGQSWKELCRVGEEDAKHPKCAHGGHILGVWREGWHEGMLGGVCVCRQDGWVEGTL